MIFREVHCGLDKLRKACDYAANPDHPNHKEIQIAGPQCVNCASVPDFLRVVEETWNRYKESNLGRGGPMPLPGSEMVVASKTHANLKHTELARIADRLISLNPGYPLLLWWHINKRRKRTDGHFLIGDFSLQQRPTFRRLCFGSTNKNYTYFMQRAIEDVVVRINEDRWVADEDPLEFWSDSVLAKKIVCGWVPLHLQLLFTGNLATEISLVPLIRGLGHGVDGDNPMNGKLRIRFKGARKAIGIDVPDLLSEWASPRVPQIRYRSRSGRLPPHLHDASLILATWRDRVEKILNSRQARSR